MENVQRKTDIRRLYKFLLLSIQCKRSVYQVCMPAEAGCLVTERARIHPAATADAQTCATTGTTSQLPPCDPE